MACSRSTIQLVQEWGVVASPQKRRKTRVVGELPQTSAARLRVASNDLPVDASYPSAAALHNELKAPDTVLYLGYGSNLCAETFLDKRGIKPLSQINVVVPELSLTFDLPGFAYAEPCFGNVRYRDLSLKDKEKDAAQAADYHKNHWPKGLVGVVYEVTREDYIHIIATEGGGASYHDVLVDCYALSSDPKRIVPMNPSGQSFKAHTLFSPPPGLRKDTSYAQPSPRYLKLITDGASEHALPYEYQEYLNQIRTYNITTNKQRLGQFVFLSIWAPFFLFIRGGSGIFLKPDGTYPEWFAKFMTAIITACWASYDHFFKDTFGDGERTIGDSTADEGDETRPLIEKRKHDYGTALRSAPSMV